MNEDYFHRVAALSPTRFWINNPTLQEADLAISAGAIGCTTNPTFCMRMIKDAQQTASRVIDEVIEEVQQDDQAAEEIQKRLVKPLMEKFLPAYFSSHGKQGFVSIQSNPFTEDDSDHVVDEALRSRNLANNFIAKIPATKEGLEAMGHLIQQDMPVIATEVMAVSQAIHVWEMYERVSKECGKRPPFFVTHITGIFDEYLQHVVEHDGIQIAKDLVCQAGCIVARKQYKILKERGYSGIMLGGGARDLHHFTEMVGSEMHITINWKGTADKLIETDPSVVHRMFTPTPQNIIDELVEKIPDFRRAYMENGLGVDAFKDFGPVALFRGRFEKGWRFLMNTIMERRAKLQRV